MEKEIVFHKIRSKIDIGKDVFFVFASKSAINVTEETIKEKSEIIASENYDYSTNKLNNNEDERVWIFEKINSSLNLCT